MKFEKIKCPEYGIVLKEQNKKPGYFFAEILPEYDKSELDIPEEINGMRISGLDFMSELPSAVRKIRLSRSVEHIDIGSVRSRFLEIEIDGENPYLFTDGKAVYTRDGGLLLFYAGGCTGYEVREGTRIIKQGAFRSSPNLRRVKLPRGVEVIDVNAFFGMTALREINIPDGVTVLGENAFFGCKKLETLHIPKSVKTIGRFVFPRSGTFRAITVDEGNPYFTAENGILYSKDKTLLIFAPPKAVSKSYAVPDGVEAIGFAAFHGSPELEEIVLPPSVTEIGGSAFCGCLSLRRINLENVKRISDYAFEGCSRLTSAELFCAELGEGVFRSCYRLKTVSLANVKKINKNPLECMVCELIISDDIELPLLCAALSDHRKTPHILSVRCHKTKSILYKLNCRFETAEDARNLTGCLGKDGFDFESYDRYWCERLEKRGFCFEMTKVRTSYLRLKYPVELSAYARGVYRRVLSGEAEWALDRAIKDNNAAALPECAEIGMINPGNIVSLIGYAAELNAVEFTAVLLELKNRFFPDAENDMTLE